MTNCFWRLVILLLPYVQDSSSRIRGGTNDEEFCDWATDYLPDLPVSPYPHWQIHTNEVELDSADFRGNFQSTTSSSSVSGGWDSQVDNYHQHSYPAGNSQDQYHDSTQNQMVSSSGKAFGSHQGHFDPSDPMACLLKVNHLRFRACQFQPMLIDVEPDESDTFGNLVIEAINALEFENKIKFFYMQHDHQLFCLKPQQVSSQFFDYYTSLSFSVKVPNHSKKNLRDERAKQSWKAFVKGEPHIPKIEAYKKHILHELRDTIESSKAQIPEDSRMKFQQGIALLPYYLLYVEMISAILPDEKFDIRSGKMLKKERDNAAQDYLVLLCDLIPDRKTYESGLSQEATDKLNEGFQRKTNSHLVGDIPFVWIALQHWLSSPRPDNTCTSRAMLMIKDDKIARKFKLFFNDLVYCWVKLWLPEAELVEQQAVAQNHFDPSQFSKLLLAQSQSLHSLPDPPFLPISHFKKSKIIRKLNKIN